MTPQLLRANDPVPTTPPPAGKSLFSQHYLQQRLPDHAEWQEDAMPAFAALRSLWAKARQLGASWNEAQTEDEFIKPALEILGWKFMVQAKSQKKGSVVRPDYALFGYQAAKDAAYPHQGHDESFYVHAAAIAEAKYWGRPLSQQDTSGRNAWKAGSNPSHQMVSYLVGTRVAWGILTNGAVWRLYSREASSVASDFYEVDLAAIFDALPDAAAPTDDQLAAFKRWWLFFRRDAFVPGAAGRTFVEQVLEGSATYARRISDKLKDLVFQEVMPEIAGGFVAFRRRQLGRQEESEESLREVYGACLSLLYKLLFVLYAEARSLLPMANAGYREQSLSELARWAASRIDQGGQISDGTYATPRYEALVALFRRIDQGEATLGIPRYDGGLFHPANPDNVFLERHKLSDRVVARVVDTMVRDAGEPVDYAYISVRNLGAIYEGLLEYRLQVIDAAAGKVELVDAAAACPATGQESPQRESALRASAQRVSERKLSGSYYTPDYIVEYIVQQTLDPILDERAVRFGEAMDRCARLRGQLNNAIDRRANEGLRADLDDAERDAREALLGIKVCDPAMGSGHFLVNAVDHLTDGVIRRMQVYHDTHPGVPWDVNPIQRLLVRMRGDILAEMAEQGIAVDAGRLDDTALLTRLVMKRCIYGVDLNPMAVELAKLSLWLHSFTVGAPLSFLDHHLRWGNSIIGSDVRTVEQAMKIGEGGQLALFQGPFAGLLDLTAMMIEVAERGDATLADVQRSAQDYASFQAQLTPYKRVLDLWVSQYFPATPAAGKNGGVPVEFLTLHGEDVLPALSGKLEVDGRYQAAIERARTLWEERRFFHWDLEFPEVFVDLRRRDWAEDPGFDAVIGNPPYVRQEMLTPLKSYLQGNYASFHSVADLYLYFYERALGLLRRGGWLAYISSGTFARANFAAAFRKWLPTVASMQSIIDFGENQPFEGAEMVHPSIAVFLREATRRHDTFRALFISEKVPTSLRDALSATGSDCDAESLFEQEWVFQPRDNRQLLRKMLSMGTPLLDLAGSQLLSGIKTGLNEAFIIDEITRARLCSLSPEISSMVRRSLRGEDLRPWYQEDEGRWMIVIPSGWTRSRFGTGLGEDEAWRRFADWGPALARHLEQFRDAARARQDKGEYWWELRSCDYYDAFDQPKIFWPDVAKLPRFSWDDENKYINNTGHILPDAEPALLAVLQSRVTWFTVSQICQPLRLRAGLWQFRLFPQYVGRLPIPELDEPDKTALGSLAMLVTERARRRYQVDRRVQHRIGTDLGGGLALNQKLTAWWDLDFGALRAELKKAFRQDIPVRQRDEWESWLAEGRDEHRRLTAEIVRLETEMNRRVYEVFELTAEEIRIVEDATKYEFGVV